MLIGYARVSTQDQNLDLQRQALTQAGCQKVLEDTASGARADRAGLAQALDHLREGIRWWSGSSTVSAAASSNWLIS